MSYIAKRTNDRIEIYENGSYRNCVTLSDLRAVACDGTFFAALRSDRVEIYRCSNCHYIRTIDRKADGIQLSCGTVSLQMGSRIEEYNAETGRLERITG